MSSIGFVVPVLPGKEQADLDWMNALDGARREEYRAAWSEAGFKRHTVWQQQTPNGTVDIVVLEADDIPAAMAAVSSSEEPFLQWFRERVLDSHGIDLAQGAAPQPTLLHDASF
ncbi:MAG: hypothetical protein QOK45_2162 [Mycobacterium sp.]|jgi:hypothetical protein|nr:hypothetical protein [Mycobacterium sp.]MDT7794450.1 hypothetical protein [Mycobacterium sp.]